MTTAVALVSFRKINDSSIFVVFANGLVRGLLLSEYTNRATLYPDVPEFESSNAGELAQCKALDAALKG